MRVLKPAAFHDSPIETVYGRYCWRSSLTKSTDLIRHENRRKRGGKGNTDNRTSTDDLETRQVVPLSQVIEQRPAPEFAALISSQFELLIQKINCAEDADLLHIAVAKMMGDSNGEVAQQLGCARRTVERKIRLIQRIWEREIDDG